MLSDHAKIDRRTFITTATPFALALPGVIRGRVFPRGSFRPDGTAQLVQRLLGMVNRERAQFGLSQLVMDDLACRVAANHARDMVDGLFLSHWGRDGRKPYQRYSFAGGNDANQENAASFDDVDTAIPQEVEETVIQLHRSMFEEVPPNDGHRRTILFPYHTHVGFGIALKPDHIRMAELYLCRYAEVGPTPRATAPGTQINFSGRLLNSRHSVAAIHVYHEPVPQPPSFGWLREARPYGLPETYTSYWPRLYGNSVYEDGTRGTIEVNSKGNFRTPLFLYKEPGINTIVVWLERGKKEEPFPITQVCVRCE